MSIKYIGLIVGFVFGLNALVPDESFAQSSRSRRARNGGLCATPKTAQQNKNRRDKEYKKRFGRGSNKTTEVVKHTPKEVPKKPREVPQVGGGLTGLIPPPVKLTGKPNLNLKINIPKGKMWTETQSQAKTTVARKPGGGSGVASSGTVNRKPSSLKPKVTSTSQTYYETEGKKFKKVGEDWVQM
ncbi:MAG: hypothetical protein KA715_06200 [Xanthomonadaceae bacterium]|nr:hypothetical protein [Xanthomonadaceae bacterium]